MVHRQLALILAQEEPLPDGPSRGLRAGVHASVFTMEVRTFCSCLCDILYILYMYMCVCVDARHWISHS